jgi:hypothetical protein
VLADSLATGAILRWYRRAMDTEAFWAGRESELEEYARLALRVGVNLARGQDVALRSYVEHAPLAAR